jgi:predicted kinase
MSQPLLIIICGVPGSGKSTFARHVAPRWNASWFASETFANELGAAARSASGDLSKEGIEHAYKAMGIAVRESFSTNKLVLAVGSFRSEKQRERFREIAASAGATVRTIRVLCYAGTAAERVRSRLANGEHGPIEDVIRQIDAELRGATDIDLTVSNESSFNDFYRRIDTVMQHCASGSLASVDGVTSNASLKRFGESVK